MLNRKILETKNNKLNVIIKKNIWQDSNIKRKE